jgi:hypothetical protein
MSRTAFAQRQRLSRAAVVATLGGIGCGGATGSTPLSGGGGLADDAQAASGEAGIASAEASDACAPSLALCSGVCIDGAYGSAPCTPPHWTNVASARAGAIAVDANNVYWTEATYPGGSVMKQAKSGGAAVTLASSTTVSTSGIAVDSTNVYWGEVGNGPDSGSIVSLPVSANGGTPNVLTTASGANVLALSGSTLCFGATVVGCLPVTGGTPTILNTVESGLVLAMAVDATNAYWTTFSTNGAVFSAPIAGGPVNLLVPHTDQPKGIAVDANNVYWTGGPNRSVNAMPIGGGPVTTLATGPGAAQYLALDSGYLFWTAGLDTNNGAILRMPVTGGTPTVIAWGTYGGGPLVVDSQFVYFIQQNGWIAKVPR